MGKCLSPLFKPANSWVGLTTINVYHEDGIVAYLVFNAKTLNEKNPDVRKVCLSANCGEYKISKAIWQTAVGTVLP